MLKPLKIVSNPGNGGAGLVIDLIENDLPFQFVKLHHEPDGTFPHGVPNPMLEENRAVTVQTVLREKADIGIAFDGDFDRCFFFDEQGTFIEGYYIVGLLASVFLKRFPGGRIVHDPRLTWNTLEIVKQYGGKAVQCKSGHAFIKQAMREVDAVYGGEMSAHHYFRDFAYCDSGMIPWLVLGQLLSETGKPLSALVGERMRLFPASGEINRKLVDQKAAIEAVKARVRAAGAEGGIGRRLVGRVRAVALQPALVEHRAAGPAERGKPRRCRADERPHPGNPRVAGALRIRGVRRHCGHLWRPARVSR